MRAFVVDAFTDRPFAGNPAAVCLGGPDEPFGDPGWMQAVAAEFNLAETAFLAGVPDPGDGGAEASWECDLRWFTPAVEVDLCGHATLAAAHVLWQECGHRPRVLRFRTRSGVLRAERAGAQIALALPRDHPNVVEDAAARQAIETALGVPAATVHRGRDDLLVEVADPDTVSRVRPDLAAIARLDARGVIVTAAGSVEGAEADFVSRFFAPAVGVDEDPVTGSAHCLLGPFWAGRLGGTRLRAAQLSPRGGRLVVEVGATEVRLTGAAVSVLRGELPTASP